MESSEALTDGGFTEKLDRFTIVDRYESFIEQDKTDECNGR